MRYVCGPPVVSDYDRRYDAAMKELGATDIWKANFAPPLLLAQRKLGLKPRPPHYLSSRQVVLGYGACFGVVWGTIMWVTSWSGLGLPVAVVLIVSVLTGIGFGFAIAYVYRRVRRKYGLSVWEDL